MDILTISGMNGVGKTSLAKYVYRLHSRKFDASSFIEDISRRAKTYDGLINLQKQLCDDISKPGLNLVRDASVYTSTIENVVARKKVFIVLDDVNSLDQLDALHGRRGFHPGSKIIVTTNDASLTESCALFKKNVKPKHTQYLLEGLHQNESRQLLCFHAFKCNDPKVGYGKVLEKLLKYCEGHPLALEVLGKSMRYQDLSYWKGCIKGLKKEVDYVEKLLMGDSLDTRSGFNNLINRGLLSIGYDKFMMSSLLQDMGRFILYKEAADLERKRGRLWRPGESLKVLKLKWVRDQGTGDIRTFELCMLGFLLKSIYSDLSVKNVVALEISYSNIESFGICNPKQHENMQKRLTRSCSKDKMLLRSPKILTLSFCEQLRSLRGFDGLPVLDSVIVNFFGLNEVCESIEVRYCNKLKNVLTKGKLENVKTLLLDGCNLGQSQIKTRNMDSPQTLKANHICMNTKTSSSSFVKTIPSDSTFSMNPHQPNPMSGSAKDEFFNDDGNFMATQKEESSKIKISKAVSGSSISKSFKAQYIKPQIDKQSGAAMIPIDVVQRGSELFSHTLYGYFVGEGPAYSVVNYHVRDMWQAHGIEDVLINNQGTYFFKFTNKKGMIYVMDNGPWMIENVPIFLKIWEAGLDLSKPIHDKVPSWIKIFDIPIELWTEEGLNTIASNLGNPLAFDSLTTNRSGKGEAGYAKVLIEVSATEEGHDEIRILVPKLNGSGSTLFRLRVEYMWKPRRWSHCKVFGHDNSACFDLLSKHDPPTQEVDAKDFQKVSKKPQQKGNIGFQGSIAKRKHIPPITKAKASHEKLVMDDEGFEKVRSKSLDQKDRSGGQSSISMHGICPVTVKGQEVDLKKQTNKQGKEKAPMVDRANVHQVSRPRLITNKNPTNRFRF